MAQLIDSQTCESYRAGWNPKLHISQCGAQRLKPYVYKVFIPFSTGLTQVYQSSDRVPALRFFLAHPDAVIRMELACSELCVGLAINGGNPPISELPLEQA